MRQVRAFFIRDLEAQNILHIVFNRVPSRCPNRKRKIETSLVDVCDISRHMKNACFRIRDINDVVDVDRTLLSDNLRSANEDQQRQESKMRAQSFAQDYSRLTKWNSMCFGREHLTSVDRAARLHSTLVAPGL